MKKVLSTDAKKKSDKFKHGQIIEVVIDRLNDDGFGVSSHEGTPVLIAGGLPGETIRAKITYVGRRETFAAVVKIIQSSPDRVVPPNCNKGACDGCALLQLKYPAQLAWKKQLTIKSLRNFKAIGNTRVYEVIPSPKQLNYRNSAKLIVSGKFANPVIGIYRRNSHEVLEISGCTVHHPLIDRVIEAVKAGIKKGRVPIYNPKSRMGLLRYLVIRVSESANRAMVIFVTAERSYNEIHHLAKYLKNSVPEVSVIAQNVNNSQGNVILGQKDYFITREQALSASVGNVGFLISPRSFFQINSGSALIIYEKVREWGATGAEQVLDLYCGIGGISLFIAPYCKEVIGIEAVEAAVEDAEKNARLNGIGNCRFIAGDVARLLEEKLEDGEKFDLIILNPPRKGCDEKVLEKVASLAPAKIIYVSCSPDTLARDLNMLAGLGYQTKGVQPVDMFPQTPHVENVALLIKH